MSVSYVLTSNAFASSSSLFFLIYTYISTFILVFMWLLFYLFLKHTLLKPNSVGLGSTVSFPTLLGLPDLNYFSTTNRVEIGI